MKDPMAEDGTFIGKSLGDHYNYYAFIRDFGWLTFTESKLVAPGIVRLKEVEFFQDIPSNPAVEWHSIKVSAKDDERGVEVQISDIVLMIDSAS